MRRNVDQQCIYHFVQLSSCTIHWNRPYRQDDARLFRRPSRQCSADSYLCRHRLWAQLSRLSMWRNTEPDGAGHRTGFGSISFGRHHGEFCFHHPVSCEGARGYGQRI